MMRTTVRCGDVAITTPLSPANGPKWIVTTVPLVTSSLTQITAAGRRLRIVQEVPLILGLSSKGTVTPSAVQNRIPV